MQPVSLYDNQNVADIVRSDYRTAEVFKAYGINYCCEGSLSLEEACRVKNVVYADLIEKLNQVSQAINLPFDIQFHRWRTDFLIDYIINIHHAYFRDVLPRIENDIQYLIDQHPNKYPLLKSLETVCLAVHALLTNEFRHQEESLFPYIKQIYSAYSKQESYGKLFVRTLRKPIDILNDQNRQLNEHLHTFRQLTHNYEVSPENFADYNVLMKRLREFDNQLVLHKHIENNILFPAAISMEEEILKP